MVYLLDKFSKQRDFAYAHNVGERTVARYRAQGLPWMRFGGEVYIGPKDEAETWLLRRVHRTDGGRNG